MDILLKSRESGRKNYKSITNDNDIIIYPGKKSLESIKDSSRNIKKINILNDKKTFSGIKNYSENNGNLKNNISRSFSMNSIVSKNNGNELNKEEKRLFQFNSIINSWSNAWWKIDTSMRTILFIDFATKLLTPFGIV